MRGWRVGVLAAGLVLAGGGVTATALVAGSDRADGAADSAGDTGGGDGDDGDASPYVYEYGGDEAIEAIEDVLEARAEALVDGDRDAFVATLFRADRGFVRQQVQGFENLQDLRVREVVYGVTDRLLPVSTVPGDDPELKPEITEHVRLGGVDQGLVSNAVGFTFVEHDGEWLMGAERLDETQGVLTSIGTARPWAEGPVAVRRSGPLTVVVDAERAGQLRDLTARAARALDYVRTSLDSPRDRTPLLVDATSTGTATRLSSEGTTVADAVFGPAVTLTATGLKTVGVGGWRLKYNPDRLEASLGSDLVLRHELTHFVLREKPQPLWLEEGLAEYLGWEQAPLSRLGVPAAVHERIMRTAPRRTLPTTEQFRTEPAMAYSLGQGLVEALAARGGLGQVVRLVDTLAREAGEGTPLPRAERVALQRVFGLDETEVAEAGYARLQTLTRL